MIPSLLEQIFDDKQPYLFRHREIVAQIHAEEMHLPYLEAIQIDRNVVVRRERIGKGLEAAVPYQRERRKQQRKGLSRRRNVRIGTPTSRGVSPPPTALLLRGSCAAPSPVLGSRSMMMSCFCGIVKQGICQMRSYNY